MKALLLLLLLPAATPLGRPRPAAAGRVPVVVELFTSEGCSSCPAADAVLRELAASQPVPGVEVLVLGEHVDYWNRLGWADPFSAPEFSARQRAYARTFGEGSYTPQAVVAGRYELVGSRRPQLLQRIAEAAHAPQASVQLRYAAGSLSVRVASLPAGTAPATVELALTEANLATQVQAGENAGALLRHAPVVRMLRQLGTASAAAGYSGTVSIHLAPAWRAASLRAVVLVRDSRSQQVLGAASLPLAAPEATPAE